MNEKMSYGIIGLLLGIIVTWIFATTAVSGQHTGMMWMMGDKIGNQTGMTGVMQGMMTGLEGKTGDAFDKAFLSEMSVHHQGAINMATAALKNAQHQEIKDLAKNIIDAQTKEINQMQNWQAVWYK